MRLRLFACSFLLLLTTVSKAQFGISYHQSNLPFLGINYTLSDRFFGELRIGTDRFLGDLSLEAVMALTMGKSEEVDPYVGLGFRFDPEGLGAGLMLPLGLNIYPFSNRRLGCHIELCPFTADQDVVIRGSWGIRYRFL